MQGSFAFNLAEPRCSGRIPFDLGGQAGLGDESRARRGRPLFIQFKPKPFSPGCEPRAYGRQPPNAPHL